MRTRRAAIPALAMLALTGAGTTAAATGAPRSTSSPPGTYVGLVKGANGFPVSFKLRRGKVSDFRLSFIVRCNTGREVRFPVQIEDGQRVRKGKFLVWSQYANHGFVVTSTGTFDGERVTGRARVTMHINDANDFDPNGTTSCDTGVMHWRARLL